jgi:hypothetical protein
VTLPQPPPPLLPPLTPTLQGGKCITVFSAPNYCDMMGNKGAVCKIQAAPGAPPEFLTYTAVPHPPVKPMQYAAGGPGGSMASMFGL